MLKHSKSTEQHQTFLEIQNNNGLVNIYIIVKLNRANPTVIILKTIPKPAIKTIIKNTVKHILRIHKHGPHIPQKQ